MGRDTHRDKLNWRDTMTSIQSNELSLVKSFDLRPYQQDIINLSIDHFRKTPDPIIIDCCVGGGKTLIISHIARHVIQKGGRVISLAHTKELVESAHETFIRYAPDLECGIFSASMGRKDIKHDVTFCSEKSLVNSMAKFKPIDLLIIDEAHRVNDKNEKTCYMRIIKHFQDANPKLRIVGLTGTSFRTGTGKIAGKDKLFTTVLASINVLELVEQGYLTRPIAPITNDAYDFSGVKVMAGKFNDKDLQVAVSDGRLTKSIIENVMLQTADRNKVLIFASTLRHAQEIVSYLPKGEAGYLDGTLSKTDREAALKAFSNGTTKYMVNRDILTVGYNQPAIDAIAVLRPTESRGLLIQMIGRGLRLHPSKADVMILDYAANFEKHGDLEEIFLKEAKSKKAGGGDTEEKECPQCGEWVSMGTRHCSCGFYFISRECPDCGKENDITRKYCYSCDAELIDPNAKLTSLANVDGRKVSHVTGLSLEPYFKTKETLKVSFSTDGGVVSQYISPGSSYMKYFLGKFLKCRGTRLDTFMQMSIKELAELLPLFQVPTEITTKPDGKFKKIVGWNF